MTNRLMLAMPGNEPFATQLAESVGAPTCAAVWRRFPDGETCLRIDTKVSGAEVLVVCTLAEPDPQILRLLFAAHTLRDLGVAKVTLIAPYLAYMRQDMRFHPGEAITSIHFAKLISDAFDELITVDPHLHRYKSMDEIYAIPAVVLHAAPLLARWLRDNVEAPLIVGPDEESEQWVSEVAAGAGAPFVTLRKTRLGDRDVRIVLPDMTQWQGRVPVLVDDIVSSGQTMREAARQLVADGWPQPVCVAVHALFAGDAYETLRQDVGRIVSTNTISHLSNQISIVALISDALSKPRT